MNLRISHRIERISLSLFCELALGGLLIGQFLEGGIFLGACKRRRLKKQKRTRPVGYLRA